MTSLQDGEVAQQNVAAVLQRDGFVADAGLLGFETRIVTACSALTEGQTLTVDQSGTDDRYVAKVLSVEEGIWPVVVTVVLIFFPRLLCAGWVIDAAVVTSGVTDLGRVRGEDGTPLRKIQTDIRS